MPSTETVASGKHIEKWASDMFQRFVTNKVGTGSDDTEDRPVSEEMGQASMGRAVTGLCSQ